MMWLGTERRKGDARNRNTLVPTMRLWVAVVIQESPPKNRRDRWEKTTCMQPKMVPLAIPHWVSGVRRGGTRQNCKKRSWLGEKGNDLSF